MYVWLRGARLLAASARREKLDLPFGVSELAMRAWPGDCDVNFHVNNGRYATITDLGRYDLLFRTGMWAGMRRLGLTPLLGGTALTFRREIRLWQRFALVSRIVAWEDRRLVFEHRFLIRRPGEAAAETAVLQLAASGLYDSTARRFEPIERVFARLGAEIAAPEPDATVREFLDNQDRLRESALR
jgi:acyl-CoA thioesterase FadM